MIQIVYMLECAGSHVIQQPDISVRDMTDFLRLGWARLGWGGDHLVCVVDS